MNSRTREEYRNQKEIFELLGLNYIDFRDKRVINYVAKAIKNINTGADVSIGSVSYADALIGSIENIKVFGVDIASRVSSIVSNLVLQRVCPVSNGYMCNITYTLDDYTKEVDFSSGRVDHYKVPIKPDIMASFHLGHEHIHALKETNYNEYIDGFVLGDVITMLYEFIIADTYPELKNYIYRFRLHSLKLDYTHYENAIIQMKKSREDKDLYKIIATRSGQYLNSYYYACILFNMYKSSPLLVLDMVNSVLKHEMTTRDLLKMLGLFQQDKDSIFDAEIAEIKKYVKKV